MLKLAARCEAHRTTAGGAVLPTAKWDSGPCCRCGVGCRTGPPARNWKPVDTSSLELCPKKSIRSTYKTATHVEEIFKIITNEQSESMQDYHWGTFSVRVNVCMHVCYVWGRG